MKRLKLTQCFEEAYKTNSPRVLHVKSVFVTICASIERHIRLELGIDIHAKLTNTDARKLKELFPPLENLNVEQMDKILIIFQAIRNVNAHFVSRKPVFIDDDIIEYFTNIHKPEYPIYNIREVDRKKTLTLFGAFYFLIFLSQKYMVFTFVTHFYHVINFEDINPKTFGKEQTELQHTYQEFCGKGKTIKGVGESTLKRNGLEKIDIEFINNITFKHLSNLFFDFEKMAQSLGPKLYSYSFKQIIWRRLNSKLSNKTIQLVTEMRNSLFHGYRLFDKKQNSRSRYELIDLIKRLIKILTECKKKDEFSSISKDIEAYGLSLYNFFALRLIEVSYKLLDSSLLTKEKIDKRVQTSIKAYKRLANAEKVLKCVQKLIIEDEINWKLEARKFLTGGKRRTKTSCLKLYEFNSKKGFDIGDIHTDEQKMVLANVDLEKENQNQINAKSLESFKKTRYKKICKHIVISKVKMK